MTQAACEPAERKPGRLGPVSAADGKSAAARPVRLLVRLRAAALVLLGAAMLMAVTVAIGRPTVFTDTDDYYAQGHSLVRVLDAWIGRGVSPIDWEGLHYRLTAPDGADEEPVHNQDAARSAYYGVALYLAERFGSLWLFAALQATLAAGLIYAAWRAVAPDARLWTYAATMTALAAGSTLPVFTGFAMPDVFAGFAALTTVLLTVYPDRFGRIGQALLWLVLAASLNFHGSNLLTSICIAAVALAALRLAGVGLRPLAGRAALVLAAAAVAVLAAKAYGLAVKLRTGDEFGRPPFLMARVLADGPGREYLPIRCKHPPPLALCAYQRLPLDDTEDILWSDEPTRGIFNIADFHTRQRLEHEELGFVLGAVAHDPIREARAALGNWGAQLADIGLDEPLRDQGYYLRDPYWRTTTLPGLIRRAKPCPAAACDVRLDGSALAWLYAGALVAALMALGWRLWRVRATAWASLRRSRGSDVEGRAALAALLLAGAIVVNAAVCGMLSGPFARYEARITWLGPAAAMLLILAVPRSRGRPESG